MCGTLLHTSSTCHRPRVNLAWAAWAAQTRHVVTSSLSVPALRQLLLAAQDQRLDAVLVLRVQGGNDIFCSLSGRYLPSFFGLHPSTLAALPRSAAPDSPQQAAELNIYFLASLNMQTGAAHCR